MSYLTCSATQPRHLTASLVRCSSTAIHETAPKRTVRWRRASPDPGLGVVIELGRGDARGVGDVVGVGQRRAGERFAAEDPPSPLDEVEPGSPNRNEGVLDTWMRGQPVGDRATQMAGQVVGDERAGALRIGLVERLQPGAVATRVARRRGLREDLAIAHAQGAVHPHLLDAAVIV